MTSAHRIALPVLAAFLLAGCGGNEGVPAVNRWVAESHVDRDCEWLGDESVQPVAAIAEWADAYAVVELAPDLTGLGAQDKAVLDELVAAGRIVHDLFKIQATPCYDAIAGRVAAYAGADAAPLRRYFAINAGPWDRRQHYQAFVGGWEHAEGANFYPRDLTRADRDQLADPQGDFSGLFTMIRRDGDGELVAIPYREFFAPGLTQAAEHLRKAAALTDNPSLRAFLEARAASFLSDDYYESDMLWMDLDSRIEITIGPYEVYEDGLFGYKAAFECFVTVTDPAESARLAKFKDELPWLEQNLPLADEHKNPNRGSESPIRVVDLVYAGGDTRAGIQTIAFNLPNDERVREAKGSKKVLLRNMMDAKFSQILQPIAARLVADDQLGDVTAESFFLHTLWHEMSHGLGPGKLVKDGRETEVRLELKDTYATIEEAKADLMGEWDILTLHRAGRDYFPPTITAQQPATFLAGLFRSVRFGISEAHGQANAIQFNYLVEQGAIVQDPATGKFRVVHERFLPSIEQLLREILAIQAAGDQPAAQALIERYAQMPQLLSDALGRLEGIPVDIQPVFRHYPDL
ncbi:MAG TPA: peptidase [Candidatus Krumholzibacteria bacterium]|nr:peptidase [Candidatus Krumholzibacteria bacterium]HPD71071.1 peptidase [Candidatus Krumholzibacteria bacterium]HRY39229.1 peptidase [Candidatus Krumholzibacteria bacterium]